jgi:putative ABC transport system permease protein
MPRAADEHWTAPLGTGLGLAWRNLTADPRRWVMSSAAMGIASLLVLFMQGVSRWVDTSTTAYLDHVRADVVVTQAGVDDLLFSQAVIPDGTLPQLVGVPRVVGASQILTINGVLSRGGTPLPVFIVGYPPNLPGGPWAIAGGRSPISTDEVVLDRSLATNNNISVGDAVSILGHSLRVVGLSSDTNAAGIFFVFVPLETAQSMAGAKIVSFSLLRLTHGASVTATSQEIDRLAGVHSLSPSKLAKNDLKMINAGFSQPLNVVIAVCLVVGVLIAGIVLYTATVEHARDFAVLKAIGARFRVLAMVALGQALVLTVCGFLLGWAMAGLLVLAFRTWLPVIDSQIDPDIAGKMFALILAVNLLAVVQPLRFLRRVDPQEVFKA